MNGARFIPGPDSIMLSWDFKSFCGIGGLYLKTV